MEGKPALRGQGLGQSRVLNFRKDVPKPTRPCILILAVKILVTVELSVMDPSFKDEKSEVQKTGDGGESSQVTRSMA